MAPSDHVTRQLRVLHRVRQPLLRELVELLELDLVSLRQLLPVHLDHGLLELLAVLRSDFLKVCDAAIVMDELCQVLSHLPPVELDIARHLVAAVYEVVHVTLHVFLQLLNTILHCSVY